MAGEPPDEKSKPADSDEGGGVKRWQPPKETAAAALPDFLAEPDQIETAKTVAAIGPGGPADFGKAEVAFNPQADLSPGAAAAVARAEAEASAAAAEDHAAAGQQQPLAGAPPLAALPPKPKAPPEPKRWRRRGKAREYSEFNSPGWLVTLAGWAGLLLLGAAVAWPLQQWSRNRATAPDDGSVQAAALVIGQDAQPGDAVAYVPAWGAHRPWLVEAALAKRGVDYNSAVVLGEPLDPWDFDGKQRLWVVTTHGKLGELKMPGLRAVKQRDVGQGTGVALFEVPTSTTAYDFRAKLAEAKQTVGASGTPRANWPACPWQPSRNPVYEGGFHNCNSQDWKNTWVSLHEVGNTRRWGIYVHPPFENGTLRLEYSNLPAGRQVAGRFGNRLWAVRHGDEGSAVTLKVFAGERLLLQKTVPPNDFGWHAFAADLQPADQGQPIAFEISAAKDAWREAVLDARLLR